MRSGGQRRTTSHTRPEQLEFVGTLFGLSPAAPAGARVLELGCGDGGHLLPLAFTHRGAAFVGVDASAARIDEARRGATALGLANARFVHGDPQIGLGAAERFDYVVCDGLFSALDDTARARLLAFCRDRLAPGGIACVSVRMHPGGKIREIARQWMLCGASDIDGAARIAMARKALAAGASMAEPAEAFGRLLHAELKAAAAMDDAALFAEYLDPRERACWFQDFALRIDQAGLAYLGEASLPEMAPPPGSQPLVGALSGGDVVAAEQYHDLLRQRRLRHALLVARDAVPRIARRVDADSLQRFRIHGSFARLDDTPLGAAAASRFRTADGAVLSLDAPIQKAALVALDGIAPADASFDEWVAAARNTLSGRADGNRQDVQRIAQLLLDLALAGFVTLECHAQRSAPARGPALAFEPARRLALAGGSIVPTRRHRSIALDPARLALLSLLDGVRDETALVDALHDRLSSGELIAEQQGRRITQADALREVAQHLYRESVASLWREGLLVRNAGAAAPD
jgi:SAM-dependent methyltransferase